MVGGSRGHGAAAGDAEAAAAGDVDDDDEDSDGGVEDDAWALAAAAMAERRSAGRTRQSACGRWRSVGRTRRRAEPRRWRRAGVRRELCHRPRCARSPDDTTQRDREGEGGSRRRSGPPPLWAPGQASWSSPSLAWTSPSVVVLIPRRRFKPPVAADS
uniref:Uncharacterized protein n=1 Tax=Oryza sativa subsp. japonica TaxID=39947 RepID=Q5Z7G0_ORYSJ|nr:hypothetical protein [Oryza sativa Japonica Group]BAD54154.1 hypothetical protein [Oryza sativa Japonica Group]